MGVFLELFDDAKFIFNFRRRVMPSQKKLNRHAPKVGEMAPDFTLHDISGAESITLSDLRGDKSVALVFGGSLPDRPT